MKRRFSMGQALEAPFSLLKRRPGTVFVWGLMHLVFGCLIAAAMWPMLGQMMGDFSALAAMSDTGSGMPPEIVSQMTRFQAVAQLLNLVQALFGIVLFNAAMRAAWAGGRGDGFAFMRIGMDELRVAVAALAIFIGVYVVMIVLILVGVGVFFATMSLGEQVSVPVMIAYVGLSILATIWLLSRAMLIIPVSVIEKSFAFGSGWALGKGQAAKLAVTGFLSCVIMILIELVFVALLLGAVFGIAAATGIEMRPDTWDEAAAMPTLQEIGMQLQPFWPLLIFVIPAIFLAGFANALFAAPLASAARQLLDSGRPRPDPADHGDPHDDGLSPIIPAGSAAVALEAVAEGHGHDDQPAAGSVEAVSDGHAGDDGHGHDAHARDAIIDADHGEAATHDDHGHDDHGHAEDHDSESHADDAHAPKHGDGH